MTEIRIQCQRNGCTKEYLESENHGTSITTTASTFIIQCFLILICSANLNNDDFANETQTLKI